MNEATDPDSGATSEMRAYLSRLAALDYPTAQTIEPYRLVIRRDRRERQKLQKRRAWCVLHAEDSKSNIYSKIWLDINGELLIKIAETFVDPCPDVYDRGWYSISINDLEKDHLKTILIYLRRLLRLFSPSDATPEHIVCFGVEFTILPRHRIPPGSGAEGFRVQQQKAYEIEFQCDDVDQNAPTLNDEIGTPDVLDRIYQLRYLVLSWMNLVTSTETGGAQPEGFYKEFAPYLPRGPARPEEVAFLIKELVTAGLAEWIDDLDVPHQWWEQGFDADSDPKAYWLKPWGLIVTDRGRSYIETEQARIASRKRGRDICKALLKWVYRYGKQSASVSINTFCSSRESVVNGIAVPIVQVHRTARWLAARGYIYSRDRGRLFRDLLVGITRDGIECVDEYGGDPWEMRTMQRRGENERAVSFHGPVGNVAVNSSEFSQNARDVINDAETVDIDALARLAHAAIEALPILQLGANQTREAESLASGIIEELSQPTPSHPRLRALGQTLRTILEEAAGHALGTVLLGIWP